MAAADRRRWRRRRRRRYDACRALAAAAAAASLGGATVELPPQFDWRHRPVPTAVATLRDACVCVRSCTLCSRRGRQIRKGVQKGEQWREREEAASCDRYGKKPPGISTGVVTRSDATRRETRADGASRAKGVAPRTLRERENRERVPWHLGDARGRSDSRRTRWPCLITGLEGQSR
ncbi:hypothetical protein PUN28_009360 [Cardiocondyla obscurior]|uniref:Uncharacterized protein n=1 Tax=Cardiocondyla obscurior TaxID=286306 RepID=A0AAW2FXH2_9HYME